MKLTKKQLVELKAYNAKIETRIVNIDLKGV